MSTAMDIGVSESGVMRRFDYTKAEIRARRQRFWTEGVHYWFDAGKKTVYSIREIAKWQQTTRVLTKTEESAVSVGTRAKQESRSLSTSHTRLV